MLARCVGEQSQDYRLNVDTNGCTDGSDNRADERAGPFCTDCRTHSDADGGANECGTDSCADTDTDRCANSRANE